MEMSDLIDQFTEDIQFDALEGWCAIFKIEYKEPLDDDFPEWEDSLRVKIAEAMLNVGKKVG